MDDLTKQMIKVTIRPGGRIEYEVGGVRGSGCETLTRFLDSLGTTTLVCRTSDWHDGDTKVKVSL